MQGYVQGCGEQTWWGASRPVRFAALVALTALLAAGCGSDEGEGGAGGADTGVVDDADTASGDDTGSTADTTDAAGADTVGADTTADDTAADDTTADDTTADDTTADDTTADDVALTDVAIQAGIPHQVARVGEPFTLAIPADAFSGDAITYSARVLRRDVAGEVPGVLGDFWWQRSLDHHWLSFDGATFSGTPATYEDTQTLQLEVTASNARGSASVAFLLVVVDGDGALSAPATTEAECAHVLGAGDAGPVDAAALGVGPGDSICLRGGETTGALSFVNIEGAAGQPVYLINVDGKAYTDAQGHSYSIKVSDSNHFRLLGAGTPDDPYGWSIQGDTGPGVQIRQCYRDIEVAGLEIHDTSFAGLSLKNDGEQRPDGDMVDVRAHDLYLHHMGTSRGTQAPDAGESVYCGIGNWETGTHSIHRLRVHHVIGHDIAWDALQIKNADDGDALVERNFIRRYGVGTADNVGSHDEGLFAGEGASGVFRYNWIEDAFGPSAHGIQFFGAASTLFHHNVIVNLAPGAEGQFPIYGARKGTVADPSVEGVRFVHNTFAGFNGGTQGALVRVFSDLGVQEAANNLFVDVLGSDINITDAGGNVIAADVSVFSDAASRDLRPASDSPARGAGVADSDVTVDILGQPIAGGDVTSGAFQAP